VRVLEADIDRIRLSVWRPARAEAALLFVVIVALAVVPLVWLGIVSREVARLQGDLEAPRPERLECSWETLRSRTECADAAPHLLEFPSLAEVYLARRIFHRAQLFPGAFEAPPPVIQPLRPELTSLVSSDYERRMLGQVLRDAGVHLHGDPDDGHAGGWVGRDPILGVPLGAMPDDLLTRDRLALFQPALGELPDHSGASREELIGSGLLREIRRGAHDVVGAEELLHIAKRAADDVRIFLAIREAAVVAAVDARYEAETTAWEQRRAARAAGLATWREHRRSGLPWLIGSFLVAAGLLLPLSWLLRRRFTVSMDLHALTLGEIRLLWESLEELNWHHRRVHWHLDDGREGVVRDLALSDADVRILERTSNAVWLRDRGGSPNPAYRAIRSLIEGARRGL